MAKPAGKHTAYNVLDKGFVRLVDFIGGDQRAVESARVSFGSGSKGAQRDKKLVEYLLAHKHNSPFEHSVFQFHIKLPIFVARQWMRHRIASYNEQSARYTEVREEFYVPAEFRCQDTVNRQGSLKSGTLDNAGLLKIYKKSLDESYAAYRKLLESGVAREMARMLLPVAQYTQFHWTINASSLMNFLSLRMDSHAQLEIREYAGAIAEIFKARMPWTWEAFSKHVKRPQSSAPAHTPAKPGLAAIPAFRHKTDRTSKGAK
jgi:thymidylate synthase (FAD)